MADAATSPAEQADSDRVLLSVRNLHTTFKTDAGLVRAVNNVSFDVHRGEVL
ncbi:MAG: peptide ABC transporter ATP-binding protein, partial [Acidimicrobiia bacterium]|nr:peptide ABC transporter ATP-binding protein [Acidimicrobiia bacterium]